MPELTLITTQDGSHSLHSLRHGVSYHSRYGAVQEAQHVFINAALRAKAVQQRDIYILEIGFGTGLNAYITLLESIKRNLHIHYEGIEAFPLDAILPSQFNYPDILEPDTLQDHFMPLHTSAWEMLVEINENFSLIKRQKDFMELDYQDSFDIIYFDAFAPDAQPELWETDLLSKMFDALKNEGILVTYCAKGSVKRALKLVGFEIESLKGPPGKREMTRATKVVL